MPALDAQALADLDAASIVDGQAELLEQRRGPHPRGPDHQSGADPLPAEVDASRVDRHDVAEHHCDPQLREPRSDSLAARLRERRSGRVAADQRHRQPRVALGELGRDLEAGQPGSDDDDGCGVRQPRQPTVRFGRLFGRVEADGVLRDAGGAGRRHRADREDAAVERHPPSIGQGRVIGPERGDLADDPLDT